MDYIKYGCIYFNKNSIPILPEEQGLPVYTAQKFNTFERYSPSKEIEEIEKEIEENEEIEKDLSQTEIAPEEKEELDQLQDIAKKEKTPENVSNRKIPSIGNEIVNDIVIEDPETVEYKTNILRGTNEAKNIPKPTNIETNNENTALYPLTILIDKNPNNGPIGVDIEDYSFETEISRNL